MTPDPLFWWFYLSLIGHLLAVIRADDLGRRFGRDTPWYFVVPGLSLVGVIGTLFVVTIRS